MVRREFPQVDGVTQCKSNCGYPAANNIGFRAAGLGQSSSGSEPRYALMLNADTALPPDAAVVAAQVCDYSFADSADELH